MFKYCVPVLFLVCGSAFCHEHSQPHPAPAPHVNPPVVHQQQQQRQEHRVEHRQEQHAERVERHEERHERQEEHHAENHEHHVAEHHQIGRSNLRNHAIWEHHCNGGSWEIHNGCHRWSSHRILWGGNFNVYVGIFDFNAGVCIFPDVVFDFGIELPPVVIINGISGHYELSQEDVVITEPKTELVWVAPSVEIKVGFWKHIEHAAVVEKREVRVWVQD